MKALAATVIDGPWRAGGVVAGCLPARGDRACAPACRVARGVVVNRVRAGQVGGPARIVLRDL